MFDGRKVGLHTVHGDAARRGYDFRVRPVVDVDTPLRRVDGNPGCVERHGAAFRAKVRHVEHNLPARKVRTAADRRTDDFGPSISPCRQFAVHSAAVADVEDIALRRRRVSGDHVQRAARLDIHRSAVRRDVRALRNRAPGDYRDVPGCGHLFVQRDTARPRCLKQDIDAVARTVGLHGSIDRDESAGHHRDTAVGRRDTVQRDAVVLVHFHVPRAGIRHGGRIHTRVQFDTGRCRRLKVCGRDLAVRPVHL